MPSDVTLAKGMSVLMSQVADLHDRRELHDAVTELRDAVGLEATESA
jgi:hypothetical protein